MEIPKRVDIPTNCENTYYIYLHPFYFIPFTFIWSWRLCSSDIDMSEKKNVWCEYFWHPFMRLLVFSRLSVFFMWFICEVFDFAYIIMLTYIVESVPEWFHLLTDNTAKIWVEAYFQIEIQIKFILKWRVCLGWLPLFTHIEFWWHEKFL